MGDHDPSVSRDVSFDVQLVMRKESSRTSPNGEISVKWQVRDNTHKFDCQVERKSYSLSTHNMDPSFCKNDSYQNK